LRDQQGTFEREITKPTKEGREWLRWILDWIILVEDHEVGDGRKNIEFYVNLKEADQQMICDGANRRRG
jgi:hypothetical protein